MKIIASGILALFISFTASAQEEPHAYWALGGSLLTFDDGFDSIEPKQVFGRLGYEFNANFGIGFEGGFSLIEDEVFGVDFDVSTTFFYLRASIPIGSDSKLYAMIGPTNVEITASAGGGSLSADDNDTGIGFGFENNLGTSSIFVDYIIYNDNDGVDVYAINLGLSTPF
ncbi:MAG TPA: outer membrane beta-barrel protein [Gammaproteobacteria bacterium]|nr:outer membrane beta-barrel protein [Gammaproteobacteria bacterium]